MEKAIIGKKLGMSQIFTEEGKVIPVTVVEAGPCVVLQKKTVEKDGYSAVKVGFGKINAGIVNKPDKGQFKAANAEPTRYIKEFKFDNADSFEVGKEFKCDIFTVGDHVDVAGTSRGRGFTGNIQRWNAQRVGSMSHGTGPIHRSVGSMGANSTPSRVFKNKKMPGQYGAEHVTVQNLEIVRVDANRNLLLIAGGIPGAKNSMVTVKQSVKKSSGSKWLTK